ncbi:MFS transporter [Kineosporia succinea]|uniref:MFS family arabinose efflux permease n=1 Tax=Kineosporia succinea TaxID=84632 RepID=A0ABT9PEB4_9ACTN|nr:MFS transporter [Kineosporia succinea]MDP9831033.1 putative MFS family arabinose efflux permease [Kineosporia succinea]
MTLARYLAGATLARSADAGAAVGLVLLAQTAPGVGNRPLTGALLVTAQTAPHLLGPLLGRQLDRARDARVLIAGACAAYGLLLSLAALLLGRAPLGLVIVLVALAGPLGPLLTGGLSSRLSAIGAQSGVNQRRAQGWDSLSYGIAGTVGTALVAGLASITGARASIIVLGGSTLVAAVLVAGLPRTETPTGPAFPAREAVRLFTRPGPLRRVMLTVLAAAFPGGAVAVIAVAMADDLGVSVDTAGLLTAVFGAGYLTASLAMIARPLRGEPERLAALTVSLVGAGFALCALAPGYPLAAVAFFVLGATNAPNFTATLAARTLYSPPRAQGQVFVTMGALKIGASSAGAAAAGLSLALGPRVLLLAGAVLILATAAGVTLERRRARQEEPAIAG